MLGLAGLVKYVIQEEKGEEGTPHLQGCLTFSTQKKYSQLRARAKIYWRKCRNVHACKVYCSKINTNDGTCWVKGYKTANRTPKDPLVGKRLYVWQAEILQLVRSTADERTIHWFWSMSGGIGKTSLAKHLVLKEDAMVVGGKHRDAYFGISDRLKKNKDVDIVIFNLPRSVGNDMDYEAIEGIKDGLFFSSKYEGNMCVYDPPHVLVFANQPPDMSKLSSDRWKVICLDNNDDIVDDEMLDE